jgi:hypothetical protein
MAVLVENNVAIRRNSCTRRDFVFSQIRAAVAAVAAITEIPAAYVDSTVGGIMKFYPVRIVAGRIS